jgi:hypothetical protein
MERAAHGVYLARGAGPSRFLRAVSDVQGEEPHRPGMRALPGPGGGQAFLPQAPHTGRGGKRPGRVRDEDLDSLPVGRAQPGL